MTNVTMSDGLIASRIIRLAISPSLIVTLVIFGHILHRFGDIAGFCAPDPTLIPPQFWGCSCCTRSPMLGSALA